MAMGLGSGLQRTGMEKGMKGSGRMESKRAEECITLRMETGTKGSTLMERVTGMGFTIGMMGTSIKDSG